MTITKLKILTICLLWMFNPVFSQEFWRESFSIPGKGISGDSLEIITEDMEGINSWSLEYANLELSDEDDYAKTVSTGGGRFEVRDIDGEVIWRSQWINIEGFDFVDLSLHASETGSGVNSQTKYLKSFYRLDGNVEIPFHKNSDIMGNWGSDTAGCEGLSGNKVQIVCYLANHYANDKVILDEVVVKVQEKPILPALPGELLLTEVLFNPFPGGEDYVEIFNKSERNLPLSRLYLASRDKNKQLIQLNRLSGKQSIIPPGGYMAFTRDTNGVFPFYFIKAPG
ncbi:MAG TPA: hypothetical protein VKY57_14125, partial [Chitinispirillaceae bacterium]|nr:hypothetical protein [Chitinispirillaceae bacterium]